MIAIRHLAKIKNQEGAILMATIIFLTLLLLLMGIVGDYMRVFVIKRELQDAIDAAVISAAQIDAEKNRSQYIFQIGELVCDEYGCSCEGWSPTSITTKTTDNPESLMSGPCVAYRGEYNRWIDYNAGTPSQTIAQSVFNQNITHSAIIQKNINSGAIQNSITPQFYIHNNQSDPSYPSIAGEVSIDVKPYILHKIIGSSSIPITCRSQANTDYEVYSNGIYKGLSPVPADHWSPGGRRYRPW